MIQVDAVAAAPKRRRGGVSASVHAIATSGGTVEFAVIEILACEHGLTVATVPDDLARVEGFASAADLRAAISMHYPNVTDAEELIVYQFSLVKVLTIQSSHKIVAHACTWPPDDRPNARTPDRPTARPPSRSQTWPAALTHLHACTQANTPRF